MSSIGITQASYDAITAHARAAFPSECCGFVIHRDGREEAVQVTNMQDRLHAIDPTAYSRTSATAYSMGKEQLPIVRGHDRGELTIQAVYHSHPQHGAYFSDEDRRNAAPDGQPTYPDAAQIVVSVYDATVKAVKAFRWDPGAKDYGEVALQVTP